MHIYNCLHVFSINSMLTMRKYIIPCFHPVFSNGQNYLCKSAPTLKLVFISRFICLCLNIRWAIRSLVFAIHMGPIKHCLLWDLEEAHVDFSRTWTKPIICPLMEKVALEK